MAMTWLWVIVCVTVAGASADRGGSSLRGALEALQRRQRAHMHGPIVQPPDYESLYEFVPPQGYPDMDYDLVDDADDQPNPKYFVKLLDDSERPPEAYEYKIIKKKNTHFNSVSPNKQESAFRERAHATNEQLRDLFLEKVEPEKKEPVMNDNDAEYAVLLSQLWSKYKHDKERAISEENSPRGLTAYKEKVIKKRYPDNWGPIAFKRKRSSDSDIERPILPDYEEQKHESVNIDPNYNTYDLNDDDKDDLKEEYAIAFQPLDDDTLPELADDQYTYDTVEKRFPVTKRSSGPYDFGTKKKILSQNKREASKPFIRNSGTDPKILKDLSRIFGGSDTDFIKSPVKRSSEQVDDSHTHEGKAPMIPLLQHENHTLHQNSSKIVEDDDSHEHHGHNIHHPGLSGKEIEVEHNHAHKHDHHTTIEHKQADKPINIKKKSIDWSDYFGIDKRKGPEELTQELLRKPYLDSFNNEVIYPVNSFRSHNYAKRNLMNSNAKEDAQHDHTEAITIPNENKRNDDDNKNSKLDNFDTKLKVMEGIIVDEALHISNGGEKLDSKEEQEIKEKLLSRLAAAYSLEKMRQALKEFKQSLQAHRGESNPINTDVYIKAKRIAVKKELSNNEIPLSNNADDRLEDFEDEQGAGHYVNGKVEEQFSEGYMGGSGRHRVPTVQTANAEGQCPVLTKIIQRCRNVDLLAGDRGQLFLPLCSLHQICYLCGEAPPTTCDLVFLSEADTVCEGDMSCQRAARSALMALRELHDNLADELDGECEASPCLPAALKLNAGWQRALKR